MGINNVTNPINFGVEVSRGNVEGYSWFIVDGTNQNIGTTEESLWEEGGIYVAPFSASTMTVSSDDANDTSAGTGLRTVLIEGLDTNYEVISETITLNGTSGVTTSNSYLRVRRMTGETAGSTDINTGIIYIGTGTITSGKPANVFNLIPKDSGISKTAAYTVPTGKTSYLIRSLLTVDSGKEVVIIAGIRPFNGSLRKKETGFISTTQEFNFGGALKFNAKDDVDVRAKATSQGAAVDIVFEFIEVDD